MHIKPVFVLLVLSFCAVMARAQENEGILSTPNTWKREIIAFPLGFAPAIDFVGYEDLRFALGYDAFFTKDYMTLNIRVKEYFCRKTNKQIIVCDISPKPIEHAVWGIFKNVTLKQNCED